MRENVFLCTDDLSDKVADDLAHAVVTDVVGVREVDGAFVTAHVAEERAPVDEVDVFDALVDRLLV